MSHTYESPKNCKKTNPLEYGFYENVKERHYLGKYKQNKNGINYNNSKHTPEIETFNFNNNKLNNMDINNKKGIDKFNYNECNKFTFAIKSTII